VVGQTPGLRGAPSCCFRVAEETLTVGKGRPGAGCGPRAPPNKALTEAILTISSLCGGRLALIRIPESSSSPPALFGARALRRIPRPKRLLGVIPLQNQRGISSHFHPAGLCRSEERLRERENVVFSHYGHSCSRRVLKLNQSAFAQLRCSESARQQLRQFWVFNRANDLSPSLPDGGKRLDKM